MAVLLVVAAALGVLVGRMVNRAAGAFPWPPRRPGPATMTTSAGRGEGAVASAVRATAVAVRPPVLEAVTAGLFALTALRFGLSWELPAFLVLAGVGVLLAVIDLRHRLLPNRVVLPSIGAGTALLLLPAVLDGAGPALLRAVLGGAALFAVFLVLALIAPGGMGMGDVKLAALVGLHLAWLGWGALVLGAAAGFVVQAVLALVLLAFRRIGLRGELPFGPAMLLGAGLVIGLGAVPPA